MLIRHVMCPRSGGLGRVQHAVCGHRGYDPTMEQTELCSACKKIIETSDSCPVCGWTKKKQAWKK